MRRCSFVSPALWKATPFLTQERSFFPMVVGFPWS